MKIYLQTVNLSFLAYFGGENAKIFQKTSISYPPIRTSVVTK